MERQVDRDSKRRPASGVASARGGIVVERGKLHRVSLPIIRRPRGLIGAGAGGGGGGTIVQGPGRVLTNVHVKPIFWGSAWYKPSTPSVGDIMWALQSIFLGPFMSGLAQYGVGNGWLDPNPIFTGLSIEPPIPSRTRT